MKRKGARLGQHFLKGEWAAKELVRSAHIGPRDIVLEIGPGTGALTKELLTTGARIVAVEKDAALVAQLRETLPRERLVVVAADIRDIKPQAIGLRAGNYILAANIPYYITGEILRQFLSSDAQPKTMALLVQKEVARRIIARDKKESILSISVQAYGRPEIVKDVPRGNFSPPPSVDSSILAIHDISKKFFDGFTEQFFFKVLHAGFASKRKYLAGNLGKEFGRALAANALLAAEVAEKARAEDVPLEKWSVIVRKLAGDE